MSKPRLIEKAATAPKFTCIVVTKYSISFQGRKPHWDPRRFFLAVVSSMKAVAGLGTGRQVIEHNGIEKASFDTVSGCRPPPTPGPLKRKKICRASINLLTIDSALQRSRPWTQLGLPLCRMLTQHHCRTWAFHRAPLLYLTCTRFTTHWSLGLSGSRLLRIIQYTCTRSVPEGHHSRSPH